MRSGLTPAQLTRLADALYPSHNRLTCKKPLSQCSQCAGNRKLAERIAPTVVVLMADAWSEGFNQGRIDGVNDATEDEPPPRARNPYQGKP